MSKKHSFSFNLQIVITLGSAAVVLLPVFLSDTPWPAYARDYLEGNGVAASGAVNLVSAIYLGYRAFDTLGETIVLLAAVSGTIGILTKAGAVLAEGYQFPGGVIQKKEPEKEVSFTLSADKRKTHVLRTHLLEVVTGILGPTVLLFGFYVMLNGHLSPGGGFQGGVVIASGIVFLALGNRIDTSIKLTQAPVLSRMEAAAFLLLVLASVSGIVVGKGFFGNPIQDLTLIPAGFIILLNAVIGLKVGAGIGFMCIAMLGRNM